MVQNCCVVKCYNKSSKDSTVSFHSFPKDSDLLTKWISRISRVDKNGKPWTPTRNDKVCSAHFEQSDYFQGLDLKRLRSDAIPSVFPAYPSLKRSLSTPTRPSPKKRKPVPKPEPECSSVVAVTDVHDEHSYSLGSVEMQLKKTQYALARVTGKAKEKSKRVTNLSKQLGRKEKKLTELMKEVEQLKMLSTEEVETFDEIFSKESLALIENEAQAFKAAANNMRYSKELKSFAISLHFYSAQAYDYVRRYLHLPHADTLRHWASSYDVQPGFLGDVLTALKAQVAADKSMEDVCLMFDSMAIRKQVLYDQNTQKFVGYINHGTRNISSQSDREATESLVLLIVGQRKFFKHPIAYFLVDKIDAKLQSTIITDGISLLTEAGFNVVAVVCDGAFSNQATATQMGCTLKGESLQCEIAHPTIPSKSVSIMFDVCHLIKNVRNCLGELGVIKHGEDRIEWQFIKELHKIQLDSNLHLGNKLRGAHLDFIKNKMKVALAVQTQSSSVATAIDFLRDDLQLPQFAGSEATCTFIRVFDKVFDLMNSTNKLAKGFKSPLTPENFQQKQAEITDASFYIRALTDTTGKPLMTGRRKTGL